MAVKRLTIGVIYYPDENRYPFIRLRGRWLANLGWHIGQTIEVTATKEEIVIRKVKGGNENDNQPANC